MTGSIQTVTCEQVEGQPSSSPVGSWDTWSRGQSLIPGSPAEVPCPGHSHLRQVGGDSGACVVVIAFLSKR